MGDKITYECGNTLCPGTTTAHPQAQCPMPVRVELKRLQIMARMSEETTCFAADVWVDGKKVAYAKNDGQGGATMVQWIPAKGQTPEQVRAIRKRVCDYGASLCPAEYRKFTQGDEWLVDSLVNAALQAKDNAKEAKALAKGDAKAIADFSKHGMRAARFKTPIAGGHTIRWVGFKGEDEVGIAHFKAKYPDMFDWTVLS